MTVNAHHSSGSPIRRTLWARGAGRARAPLKAAHDDTPVRGKPCEQRFRQQRGLPNFLPCEGEE
jgi:hypothetical protein